MDKDGTKSGFDINILSQISKITNIPIIASGGAGDLSHFHDAIKLGKVDAVLAASVFHFGEYSIHQVKIFLKIMEFL